MARPLSVGPQALSNRRHSWSEGADHVTTDTMGGPERSEGLRCLGASRPVGMRASHGPGALPCLGFAFTPPRFPFDAL